MRQTSRLTLLLVSLILMMGTQGTGQAQEASADSDAIENLSKILGAFEYVPKKEDILKLSDNKPDALIVLSKNSTKPIFVRVRAVESLAYFKDEKTAAFLTSLLHAESEKEVLRRSALTSLAASQGEAALEAILPLLDHKDFSMRDTAIRAVARWGSEKAKELLKQRLRVEKDPHLCKTIERKIKAITNMETGKVPARTPAVQTR